MLAAVLYGAMCAPAAADKFVGRLLVEGTVQYGVSRGVSCPAAQFCALRFSGAAGDHVTATANSADGDAILWLIDSEYNILAFNDDASSQTTNAQVSRTLTEGGTYWIVFRDYYYQAAYFVVTVSGPRHFQPPLFSSPDANMVR